MTLEAGSPRERLRLTQVEATERLVDALTARGFRTTDSGHWQGRLVIPATGAITAVEVQIPADFPFLAPIVMPLTLEQATSTEVAGEPYHEVGNSWHRELNGSLCLFEDSDRTQLPWTDPEGLIGQVLAWLEQDRLGWPDDPPTLDLERYLPPSTWCIRFDGQLASMEGFPVELKNVHGNLWRVASRARKLNARRPRREGWRPEVAFVHDIGEVHQPVRDWDGLLAAAGEKGPGISAEVIRGLRHLLLLYRRGDGHGVLAVEVRPADPTPKLRAHQVAAGDQQTLTRRSHPDRRRLVHRRVAVVGVGAVGSVLADLLHRSGVGALHLMDSDLVLPGNLVRHLVGDAAVGRQKAAAVRASLQHARPDVSCTITTDSSHLNRLDQAVELLADYDLVVDATADSTASTLLATAARAGAGHLVSVAVLADGYAIRADHIPPTDGTPLDPPDLPAVRPGVYETGCGSPVSTTPPAAVWEAASLGARHTIDALLRESCAGEERILRPGGVVG